MKKLTKEIFNNLNSVLPIFWDGKESITFMKENHSRNWKQMEWPGWYFEFMCERILSKDNFMVVPGPKYDNVEFDGLKDIPWDFKAHAIESGSKVPTNGYLEIQKAIKQFGKVGFIIANGHVEYDNEDLSFKLWHDHLKGKPSQYVKDRIKRGARPRRRKVSFNLVSIEFIIIDEITINYCGSFQKGMRNADGTPRNSKVLLDMTDSRLEKYIYKVE